MNWYKCSFVLLIFLTCSFTGIGQYAVPANQEKPVREKFHYYSFGIGYGYEIPGGDLKDRFGDNLKLTLGGQYLSPTNHLFELDFNIMFGNTVKEDVLAPLRNSKGLLIGESGGLTDVYGRQRGYFLGALYGYIYSLNESQSGIRLAAGAGIMSHKIRLIDELSNVAQLKNGYDTGYDRLTRGLGLRQQIGYEHHSKNGLMNLNLVFEVSQAFTKSVRSYQFDIGKVEEGNRLDLLYTLRATWYLPIKKISTIEKVIYY